MTIRGLRLSFDPLNLQCGPGRYTLMSPGAKLVNSGASAFTLAAGFGTYSLSGQSVSFVSGSLGAVSSFQQIFQGGTGNSAGSVTTVTPNISLTWLPATGPVDHYQIIRRVNYGPDTDYATV